ncbi:DNA polymerase III subunit chi [Thalassotalea ponticola]|uniref:DNA polymerase III subunit chi n=1 Tax=Thalassotalea ponticola TaxID=1523392 RepID=UPI0025B5A91A|nr:DNA polymerase III subunit chi [Thalassotalea ponticola]MDN3653406.1 DNA polymerase III subunit chi [Thalassotalea ponticola]
MSTQVIFSVIKDGAQDHLRLACDKVANLYRQNKRVFVFCDSQSDAHKIDELLWSFDSESFIPHNLLGEGYETGSPVEISWQAPTNQRHVLVNLAKEVPAFAAQFTHILDFVPADEELKQQARLRYRSYQHGGCQLVTESA